MGPPHNWVQSPLEPGRFYSPKMFFSPISLRVFSGCCRRSAYTGCSSFQLHVSTHLPCPPLLVASSGRSGGSRSLRLPLLLTLVFWRTALWSYVPIFLAVLRKRLRSSPRSGLVLRCIFPPPFDFSNGRAGPVEWPPAPLPRREFLGFWFLDFPDSLYCCFRREFCLFFSTLCVRADT